MTDSRAKNWINLGEWGKRMDNNKLPSSDELAGKVVVLFLKKQERVITYLFNDSKSLTWKVLEGNNAGQTGTVAYEAICIAPDIFFVDFVKKDKPNESVSMAIDLATVEATIMTVTLPDIKEAGKSFTERLGRGIDLSNIKTIFQHAQVNIPSHKPIFNHRRTTDLVGKRIKYSYSHDRVYEHVYLNERMYTWHCLAGPEKGLADTERCDYFIIAPEIYLFIWREKIMPTCGAVIINLKEMRSNGKTFGLDLTTGKYVNFTMGAHAELLNITHYST